MSSAKRPRASSSSSSSLTTSTTNPELAKSQTTAVLAPPHKATRIIHPSEARPSPQLSSLTTTSTAETNNARPPPPPPQSILCNLPPTCQNRPTVIQNTIELERHYAKFHAHVCSFNNCGSVFPEERFLELHQTECHDPIAALRKDRNEKIFECHIPAPVCGRMFSTPKTRRLHLIQAHNYPKQYFFAVTNKGIGGLLKKWGEGASLIRKEWKPREEGARDQMMKVDEPDGDDGDDGEDIKAHTRKVGDSAMDTDDDEDDDEDEPADLDATPRIRPGRILSPTTTSQGSSSIRGLDGHHHDYKNKSGSNARGASQPHGLTGSADVAGLTQSLNALSLVPNSVRFGRGGKPRGFGSGGRGLGAPLVRSTDHANLSTSPSAGSGRDPQMAMEFDVGQDGPAVGRGGLPGRGFRGRGMRMRMRGRGF